MDSIQRASRLKGLSTEGENMFDFFFLIITRCILIHYNGKVVFEIIMENEAFAPFRGANASFSILFSKALKFSILVSQKILNYDLNIENIMI